MRRHLRARRRRSGSWRLSIGIVAGVVAVLVALWVVSVGTGGAASNPPVPTPLPTRTPLATPRAGTGTQTVPPTPMPKEIGLPLDRAEALALPSTTGRPLALQAFRGKQVVLYFYENTLCWGCRAEALELQTHLAAFRDRGVVVVGASTQPLDVSRRAAAQYHVTYPLLHDADHRLGLAFGIADTIDPAHPYDIDTVFVLDGSGRITWKRLTGLTVVPAAEVLAALGH